MGAESATAVSLRAEDFDRMVKGFALQEMRMLELVMTSTTSGWSNVYMQETAADLSAGATEAIKGVPRFANFPYGEVTWTRKEAYLEKYAFEGKISWEDYSTGAIDVMARTLLRISRGVARAVDTQIWNVLTESQSASTINSVTITAGNEWDSGVVANQNPIKDILTAIKNISVDNYNPLNGNGYLVLSPTDFANILANANVRNAGQFYTSDVTSRGKVGTLLGLNVLVSNVVTADYAAVIIKGECGTWKQAEALTVKTIEDPGIKISVRAWQIGVACLTNPEAVCLISNTQA